MVNIIAVDDEVADRSRGVRAVYRNPKAVRPAARPQLVSGVLLDVMHIVMQDFDVRSAAEHADSTRYAAESRWSEGCVSRAPGRARSYTLVSSTMLLSPLGRQAPAVENRVLAGLTLKRDEPLLRVA